MRLQYFVGKEGGVFGREIYKTLINNQLHLFGLTPLRQTDTIFERDIVAGRIIRIDKHHRFYSFACKISH